MKNALVALCVLLWCGAAYADEPLVVLTPSDQQTVRDKIVSNWNMAPLADGKCSQAMVVRVYVRPDGAVEDVKLLDPQPLPKDCEQAADTAKRAVWKSSPLPVPKGLTVFQVNFDHTKVQ